MIAVASVIAAHLFLYRLAVALYHVHPLAHPRRFVRAFLRY